MRSYKIYNHLLVKELCPIELLLFYATAKQSYLEDLLNANMQLQGFGLDQYTIVELAAEYTPDDEEYFGDSGVQVSVYPPESLEEMHQWLPLDEYYAYLEDCVNCCFANRPQEEK